MKNNHALNNADPSPETVEQINAPTINEGANARASLTDIKRNVATAKPEDKLQTFILNAGLIAAYARDGLLDAGECSAILSTVAASNDLEKTFGADAVREAITKAESLMVPSAWLDDPDNKPFSIAPGYSEEIQRLAALGEVEYDRERKTAAARLGIRPATLDKQRELQREQQKEADQNTKDTKPKLILREPPPWPEPVRGEDLLRDISAAIRDHVVLSNEEADAIALWIVHTHGMDGFTISPRLGVTSPEKQCGKSTLKDVISRLVWRPVKADNITSAAVYHIAEKYCPTFLIDEADTFLKDDEALRGILNSGYRKDEYSIRLQKGKDENHEEKFFQTWSATAIFLIGELPVTLHDRSIMVSLRRRTNEEAIKPFDYENTTRLDDLASMAVRWMADNLPAVILSAPELPGLYNRLADNWRPLLKIAETAGGEWPERARRAYTKAISTDDEKQSMKNMLLEDIRDIFEKRKAKDLQSRELCEALSGMEERPWPEFNRGKPINPEGLARMLKGYKVFSENIRHGDSVTKGYKIERFADAFSRFIPQKGEPTRYAATTLQPQGFPAPSSPLHNVECSGTETAQLANNGGHCSGVAAPSPGKEDFEEISL